MDELVRRAVRALARLRVAMVEHDCPVLVACVDGEWYVARGGDGDDLPTIDLAELASEVAAPPDGAADRRDIVPAPAGAGGDPVILDLPGGGRIGFRPGELPGFDTSICGHPLARAGRHNCPEEVP